MRQATWKIVISLAAAGAAAFGVFVLLEALLSAVRVSAAGSVLFRFQVSSMIAMGVFAGAAIVIYVRLARRD